MIGIVLIGQSGSGKTTLARAVAQELKIEHVSSGDIAREMAKTDAFTRAGLSRGEMAPELVMRTEIQHHIEAAVAKSGDFVLDGFPRTFEQLQILESVPGLKPLYFVLECNELVCLRRLIKRGREHDHPDAVATRFRFYWEQTEPLIGVLLNEVIELNGSRPTEELAGLVYSEYTMEQMRAT